MWQLSPFGCFDLNFHASTLLLALQLHEKLKLLGSQEPLRIPITQSAGPVTEDLISYTQDKLLEVCICVC